MVEDTPEDDKVEKSTDLIELRASEEIKSYQTQIARLKMRKFLMKLRSVRIKTESNLILKSLLNLKQLRYQMILWGWAWICKRINNLTSITRQDNLRTPSKALKNLWSPRKETKCQLKVKVSKNPALSRISRRISLMPLMMVKLWKVRTFHQRSISTAKLSITYQRMES